MATGKHKGKGKKIKFCCTRGTPCKCPSANNYRTICKPTWKDPNGKELKYEAHHALCVSSVKACLAKKRGIMTIVKETRWCVNCATNMIALPLWGHTVRWYHKFDTSPPFRNRPQHDWDHNGSDSYREEVEKSLDNLAEQIAESQEVHDEKTKQIVGKLNSLARGYKAKLKARGRRNRGTHRQFSSERGKPSAARKNWYLPFSMAASATRKGYPAQNFRQLVKDKVTRFIFG